MLKYGQLKPMEPRSAQSPFDSEDYLYQIKWDGVRIIAFVENGIVRLQNRKLRERTTIYPDFHDLDRFIKARQAILDGEMIVLANGKPSFAGILKRDLKTDEVAVSFESQRLPATYIVFDLLAYNGQDLTQVPLEDRLKQLRSLVISHDHLQVIEDFPSGTDLFRAVEEQGLEGIVAKQRKSRYLLGKKSDYWLKIKTAQDLIGVVGGYTQKSGRLSSLLLGAFFEEHFFYIGSVSSGLSEREITLLQDNLNEVEIKNPPFINPPKLSGVKTSWVQPLLTVKVSFLEWTGHFQMRSPKIIGFTKDVPMDCQLI